MKRFAIFNREIGDVVAEFNTVKEVLNFLDGKDETLYDIFEQC